MSESKPARNVAYEQMKVMLDFMGQHVDFATGSLRSLEGRHTSKKLWRELALILNNCRAGTRKTMDGWSRYWSDFKNKLKNKVRILKKKTRLGAAEKSIRPLTKLEKRALIILGPHFEKKCQGGASSNQEESDTHKRLQDLPLVKVEVEMEAPEKQKARDRSPDSTDDEATDEFEDDSDNNSTEPSINALYPKWLIEVERKRADAELSRARAEEARTQVAARAARAAATQAAALRSLARAAAAQADAVARIAAILERQPHGLLNL